jgi:hypothetical protein
MMVVVVVMMMKMMITTAMLMMNLFGSGNNNTESHHQPLQYYISCTGVGYISQRERRLFQQQTKGSRTWIMSDILQCCFSNRGTRVCK